jgi:hypothetical protein
MSGSRRRVRGAALGAALAATAALGAACGSGSGSTTPTTAAGPHHLTVTAADAGHTVRVAVPGTVTAVLPYSTTGNQQWQVASGGAGFRTLGKPILVPPGTGQSEGTETLRFALTKKGELPLVFDLQAPGPLTGHPARQVAMTLQGY